VSALPGHTIAELMNWAVDRIIEREGGFVDRGDDPGGATKYGITIKTLSGWIGRAATVDEVKALTVDDARRIYVHEYFVAPGLTCIRDPFIFELVADTAVLQGQQAAVMILQRALGVMADGKLGPKTRAALDRWDPARLARVVLAERFRSIGRIVSGDYRDGDHDGKADAQENAAGWINRVAGFVERVP